MVTTRGIAGLSGIPFKRTNQTGFLIWGCRRIVPVLCVVASLFVLCLPAGAETFTPSPAGSFIARVYIDPRGNGEVVVEVLGVECVLREPDFGSCVSAPLQVAKSPTGRQEIVWASGEQRFVVRTLGRRQTFEVQSGKYRPRVIRSRSDVDRQEIIPVVLAGMDAWPDRIDGHPWSDRLGRAIVDGLGHVVGGAYIERGMRIVENLEGARIEIPGDVSARYDGGPLYAVVPDTTGDRICVWSGSLGAHGGGACLEEKEIRRLDVVNGSVGPLEPVKDISGSSVSAVFDAFGTYALDDVMDVKIAREHVEGFRRIESSAELIDVKLGGQGAFGLLEFRVDVRCREYLYFRGGASKVLRRTCSNDSIGASSASERKWTVTPVSLRDGLVARLYSSERPAIGIVLSFHGGPHQSLLTSPPSSGLDSLGADFDILAVEYRGSSGYGLDHFRGLDGNILSGLSSDLAAAAAWARTRPMYSGKIVGVWGSSFGGVAAHLAIDRKLNLPVDFAVSESGLVENPDAARSRLCLEGGWKRQLFGMDTDDSGQCRLRGVGLDQIAPRGDVPLLMIMGGQDRAVPTLESLQWVEGQRARGACIAIALSAGSEHGLATWERRAQFELVGWLKSWLAPEAINVATRCNRDKYWP